MKSIFHRIKVSTKNFDHRNLNFSIGSSNNDHNKTFRILGVQQIAIGALDKNLLVDFWVNKLGCLKVSEYISEKENVNEDILKVGEGIAAVEIDLMQPIDPNKTPKVHIPTLNHIGLWVDNLDNAVIELTSSNIIFTPGGIRKGASGYNVAFIHPKSAAGVLIELVQAPTEIIEGLSKTK